MKINRWMLLQSRGNERGERRGEGNQYIITRINTFSQHISITLTSYMAKTRQEEGKRTHIYIHSLSGWRRRIKKNEERRCSAIHSLVVTLHAAALSAHCKPSPVRVEKWPFSLSPKMYDSLNIPHALTFSAFGFPLYFQSRFYGT